jgi:hypothetical protein
MAGTSVDEGFAGDQGRRDALKKIGIGAAGAAAAWTAPSVLSVTAAAAGSGGVGPTPCPNCDTNLVQNASFETPTTSTFVGVGVPWGVVGPVAGIVNYAWASGALGLTTPAPGGGLNTAYLGASTAMGTIFGMFPDCWGKPYAFSFWAWSQGGASTGTVNFFNGNPLGGGTLLQTTPLTVPAGTISPYALFTTAGTIPANTTAVTVVFATPAGTQMGVDLVSFLIGCA